MDQKHKAVAKPKGRWKSGNRRTLKPGELAQWSEPAGFFQGALVNRQAANKAELAERRAKVTGVKSDGSSPEKEDE